ncbi:MAG TPA: hypothetical protein VMW24_17690, partial [Sedimentisphaerales bacterium]|nr:hypothetical protein [Sedimentisphaerales bacterium]
EAVQWVPLFPNEEIRFILGAVLRCSATLCKRNATERETKISQRLRKLLIQDGELRKRPVHLDPEASVYGDDTDEENAVGRLDFRFLHSTQTHHPWPYFAIEAKRLHVTFPSGWDSCVHKYVTDRQGMMCFIEQRYARGLASGGMLGYVFDGDIERARISVAALIEANREKLKAAPPFKLVLSSVLRGDSRVSETTHVLAHGAFIIYHLFVAV